jgi:mono/diheme cytochrome c family protein
MSRMSRFTRTSFVSFVTFVSFVPAALGVVGCRQDMHNQPKYIPLRESTFFPDERSARPLVTGTVARGQLRDDALLYTGKVNGADATVFPFPITDRVMARGQERFNIYCSPCHGETGQGDGMIVRRGYRHPPTYHQDRLRDAPVGHFFDVITNGFGAMPDYAAQIRVDDRWAIIAYVRALQLSEHATIADVPADRRGSLDQPAAPPERR